MMPKGQMQFFRPTNLKRGLIYEVSPKKVNRVTLNCLCRQRSWHEGSAISPLPQINTQPGLCAVWVSCRQINCHCKK